MNRKYKNLNQIRFTASIKPSAVNRAVDKPEPQPWMRGVLDDLSEEALRDFVTQVCEEQVVARELIQKVSWRKTPEQIMCIEQLHRAAVFARTWLPSCPKTGEVIYVSTFLQGLVEVMKPHILNSGCTPLAQIFTIARSALIRLDEQATGSAWLIRHVMGWGLEDEVDLVPGLNEIRCAIAKALGSAGLKKINPSINPRLH